MRGKVRQIEIIDNLQFLYMQIKNFAAAAAAIIP
jgi:hypothetical protein